MARSLKRRAARRELLLPDLTKELQTEKRLRQQQEKKTACLAERLAKSREQHAADAKALTEDAAKLLKELDAARTAQKALKRYEARAESARAKAEAARLAAESALAKERAAKTQLQAKLETSRTELSEWQKHWAWVRANPPKGWRQGHWAKWLESQGFKRPRRLAGYSCQ